MTFVKDFQHLTFVDLTLLKLRIMTSRTKERNILYKVISQWSPRQVFLADAFGALLTTLTLSLILVQVKSHLGIDATTLYTLASFAAILFLYSSTVFVVKPLNWLPFLRIIALANMVYCPITFALLWEIHEELTTLAYVYFVGEAMLIMSIALAEWEYANNIKNRETKDLMT